MKYMWCNQILTSEESIRNFIHLELHKLIGMQLLEETLMAHIHPLMIEERMPLEVEKINRIINNQ